MVTVVRVFPPGFRGGAMGLWAAVNGAAIAAGPPLGGLVADAFGWRAVFWLDVPLAVGAVWLAWRWLPETGTRRAGAVDVAGGALLTGGLVAVMVALSQGPAWGWGSPATAALLGGGVVALGALWRRSQRVATPFVDVEVLRNRRYAVLAGIAGLQMVVLFAALFSVPLLLVSVFGHSVGRAGGVAFLLPVTMVVAGPWMGGLAQHRGARALTGWGAALLGAAAGLLALGAASESIAAVVAGLVVLGAGVSAIQSPTTARVAEEVDDAHRGVALGLFHTIRFVAGVLGTAASAAVFTGVTGGVDLDVVADDVLERAFVADFLVAAAFAAGALVLTRLVPDRSPSAPSTSSPQPQPA
jgi:MFS family permease